jgi:site-specific DNA recombinase
VCWATERLYRHPADLEDLLVVMGLSIHALHSGLVDLSSPDGIAQARIGAAMNAAEVGRLKERMNRKHRSSQRVATSTAVSRPSATAGSVSTVVRPWSRWLRRQISCARGVRRSLDGESWRSVAEGWNAAGAHTRRGGPWKARGVATLLLSPAIAGLRTHRGELFEARWEAIVDPERGGCSPSARQTAPTNDRSPGPSPAVGAATC